MLNENKLSKYLIYAIGEVAVESDFSEELKGVINKLSESPEVKNLAKKI